MPKGIPNNDDDDFDDDELKEFGEISEDELAKIERFMKWRDSKQSNSGDGKRGITKGSGGDLSSKSRSASLTLEQIEAALDNPKITSILRHLLAERDESSKKAQEEALAKAGKGVAKPLGKLFSVT